MLVFHSNLSLTFEQVHDYFRMQKLEEHNSFVLKTNTSRIAQHANQSGHDIDFNSAIIERKGVFIVRNFFSLLSRLIGCDVAALHVVCLSLLA